jgi:outer membrane receptor protein involved in Fe transport
MSERGTLLVPDLKPEIATSIEFGTDLGFFDHRLRFEGTYFKVENRNQIISGVPDASSSGYDRSNLNLGLTQSKGWEFTVGGVPIKNKDWVCKVSLLCSQHKG